MLVESAVVASLLAIASLWWIGAIRSPRRRGLAVGAVALAAASTLWASIGYRHEPPLEAQVRDRPIEEPLDGYVSSTRCRACHAAEHASWARSYHRTMTQKPGPETIRGRFDGQVVELGGRRYRPFRRGDAFFVEMDAKTFTAEGGQSPVERRVALVTGSHHMQIYWYSAGEGRRLDMFPIVYLYEGQQWIPRKSAFLQPPREDLAENARWNTVCIECHSTHGRKRTDDMDTRVSEFGIACEACHGPAAEHVRANALPHRRYALHLGDEPDETVVHPRRLPLRASSEVCGQCHSIHRKFGPQAQLAAWNRDGNPYRPGADLGASHYVLRDPAYSALEDPGLWPALRKRDGYDPKGHFWSDGMVRVSGREYNGLVESPCYQRGELTCLSCHSLHQTSDDRRPAGTWANDMLEPGYEGNEACLQCHDALSDQNALESHTHHAPDSSGSRCYDCHMPYTTYGLLKAIRSHTIDSPRVDVSLATGRTNACNLCHLDESLGWTREHLAEWYGHDRPHLSLSQMLVPDATVKILGGDAGQRAITAWAMGWETARAVSGELWREHLLAEGLLDPYDAVRFIAARSLRSHAGFEGLDYDFVGDPAERRAVANAVRERVRAMRAERGLPPVEERLTGGEVAEPAADLLARLRRERDDRPISLRE